MRNAKAATVDTFKRLEEKREFQDIRRMVDGFCSRWLLVGGRVYRTLAEEIHGEKCSANEADWDFLCFGTTQQAIQFDTWTKTRGPGATKVALEADANGTVSSYGFTSVRKALNHKRKMGGPQSLPLEKRKLSSRFEGGKYSQKVDFIAIEDIKAEDGKLEDYFAAVPIDIQAIAMDFKKHQLIGDMGVGSVCRKTIRLKNRIALEDVGNDPDSYIEMKKQSFLPMNFTIDRTIGKHKCYCFPGDIKSLFALGCKCGGI